MYVYSCYNSHCKRPGLETSLRASGRQIMLDYIILYYIIWLYVLYHMYIHATTYVYIYIYIYIYSLEPRPWNLEHTDIIWCMYVCVYICIYMYIHMYTYRERDREREILCIHVTCSTPNPREPQASTDLKGNQGGGLTISRHEGLSM